MERMWQTMTISKTIPLPCCGLQLANNEQFQCKTSSSEQFPHFGYILKLNLIIYPFFLSISTLYIMSRHYLISQVFTLILLAVYGLWYFRGWLYNESYLMCIKNPWYLIMVQNMNGICADISLSLSNGAHLFIQIFIWLLHLLLSCIVHLYAIFFYIHC